MTDNAPQGPRFAVRAAVLIEVRRTCHSDPRLVDDEPGVRSALGGVLRDEGYERRRRRQRARHASSALGRQAYDVVVLDIWLPGMDGLATLARMRERQIESQVVMISGHGNIESAVRAIKMGAFDFVEKPLSLEKTVLVVRNALRQRRLEAENQRAAREGRCAAHDGRRELRDGAAARAGRDGGADQRPRPHLRRERHRQGAGRAQHPPDAAAGAPGRSSR